MAVIDWWNGPLTLVVIFFALCLLLLTWSIAGVACRACHSSGTFFHCDTHTQPATTGKKTSQALNREHLRTDPHHKCNFRVLRSFRRTACLGLAVHAKSVTLTTTKLLNKLFRSLENDLLFSLTMQLRKKKNQRIFFGNELLPINLSFASSYANHSPFLSKVDHLNQLMCLHTVPFCQPTDVQVWSFDLKCDSSTQDF